MAGLLSVGMISCDLNKLQYTEDDSESVQNEAVSSAYFEDVVDISSTAVSTPSESRGGRRILTIADVRLSCATITLDVDSLSTFHHPIGTITIDFGMGCADQRGSTRSGKIIVNYSGRRFLPNSVTTTELDGYKINGVALAGTHTVKYIASSTEDDPMDSITLTNGTLTWPDGKAATRESVVWREWIRTAGASTDLWYVTGEAGGTNRNGKIFAAEITEKLTIQKICMAGHPKALPSSGKEMLIVGNKDIAIDFGSGSCDQMVTISIKGKSTQVDLSKSQ